MRIHVYNSNVRTRVYYRNYFLYYFIILHYTILYSIYLSYNVYLAGVLSLRQKKSIQIRLDPRFGELYRYVTVELNFLQLCLSDFISGFVLNKVRRHRERSFGKIEKVPSRWEKFIEADGVIILITEDYFENHSRTIAFSTLFDKRDFCCARSDCGHG